MQLLPLLIESSVLTVCQHNGDRSFIGIDAVNIIPWGNCSAPLLNHGTQSRADTQLRWGNIRRVQGGRTSGRKSVYLRDSLDSMVELQLNTSLSWERIGFACSGGG